MKTAQPITPLQALETKESLIPSAVIEAVNELITLGLHNGKATVKQEDIIQRSLLKDTTLVRSDFFDKRYLDFENLYAAAGWRVEYDRPGYNETYDPFFRFTTIGKK